jgi:hypothetical protein
VIAVIEACKGRADVVALDKRAGTVTVKGPRGKAVTVVARDPKNLDKVKVGDSLELVYTEAMAIAVEPAPRRGRE